MACWGKAVEMMVVMMSLRCPGTSAQRCSAGSWTLQTGTQKLSVNDSSKEVAHGNQESGELGRDRKRAEEDNTGS